MKLKIVRPDEIIKMHPNERIQFFKMHPLYIDAGYLDFLLKEKPVFHPVK